MFKSLYNIVEEQNSIPALYRTPWNAAHKKALNSPPLLPSLHTPQGLQVLVL